MQVLTTQCPYCEDEVDSTVDQLDGPIVCPSCDKPFDVEMPTAVVTSVAEVDQGNASTDRMAAEPTERILAEVHPVVFRARPFAAIVLAVVGLTALAALIMEFTGVTVAGIAMDETAAVGPASLLTWGCSITLLLVAILAGYWTLASRFATLTITDDRTIYREGIISRETSEVQHDDVRNIQLDQSFLGRLMNVGGIGISSSGQDDLEVVAQQLPSPERIIELIRENQS